MKRIVYKTMLSLLIFTLLPIQFCWLIAKADERIAIPDGVYQVELSFSSPEVFEYGRIFSGTATLTVQEGLHALSVPLKGDNIITAITAQQHGETINSLIDRDENLVQFDMKEVDQKIVVDGEVIVSVDEQQITFLEEIIVNLDSLPQGEQQETSQPTQPVVEEDKHEQPVEIVDESVSEKPVDIQPSETKKPIVKEPSKLEEKVESKHGNEQTVVKPIIVPVEKSLSFDRSMDEAIEEESLLEEPMIETGTIKKQDTSHVAASEAEPVNKFKVTMLILICILSGILLFRRMGNKKKEISNQ